MMNKIEKRNLFREAKAFFELAECGRMNIPEKAYVESYIPYIVNMAFCTELYMKLLLIEAGKDISEMKKKEYSHNLHGMYIELAQEQKDRIYQLFKKPLVYSIDAELQKMNTAFMDWRYIVLDKASGREKHFQFSPYFVKELNEILEKICVELL